jgi:hypothetical protein
MNLDSIVINETPEPDGGLTITIEADADVIDFFVLLAEKENLSLVEFLRKVIVDHIEKTTVDKKDEGPEKQLSNPPLEPLNNVADKCR